MQDQPEIQTETLPTGKPRGWLCDRCNKVLGLVKDSVELLTKLSKYLEKSNGEVEREGEEIAA